MHYLNFGIAEFQLFRQYLEVSDDDLRGCGHDLIGFSVNLHECFGLSSVRCQRIYKDDLAGSKLFLLFLVVLFQR